MFSSISTAIQSVVSAFSTIFSVLPPSWAAIIITAIGVYLTYVVIKLILDIISTFF